MLFDYNYVTFWERQNYGDSRKISDCQELGASWGMHRWTEYYYDNENTLYQ